MPQVFLRAGVICVFVYLLSLGATYNGALSVLVSRYLTFAVLGVCVVAWLWGRRARGWQWKCGAFDGVFALFVLAMAVSIFANPETAHRSVYGAWFVGLGFGVWYLLSDALANGFRRDTFLTALTASGVLLVLFGIVQTVGALGAGVTGFPRPVSLIGNSNAFGTMLVVLLPFPLVRVLHVSSRAMRFVLAGYAGVVLLLLFLTNSRGAWVAGGVVLLVVGAYALWHARLNSVSALRAWWHARATRQRMAIAGMGIATLLIVVVVTVLFLQSFGVSGRGTDRRTLLWEFAIEMFLEQPVTGQGLFSYGYHLPRYWSVPPQQGHSHPHNLPLLFLAELGLLGVVAMGAFAWVLVRAIRAQWRIVPVLQRPAWVASASALAGFGVHHLFDTTLMMPAIALLGWVLLAMVTVPYQPVPMTATWRKWGHPVGMVLLWGVVLAAGIWQTMRYERYYGALSQASEALRTGRDDGMDAPLAMLDALAQDDPNMPAYALQRGYLYGLRASNAPEYAPTAYAAYEELLRLEPYYAVGWANLAALACQMGEGDLARQHSARALSLAPDWEAIQQQYAFLYGLPDAPTEAQTPIESVYAPNTARYQYWHDVFINEQLPQVGWITPCES